MNRPGYTPKRGRTPSRTPPRAASYTTEPGGQILFPTTPDVWALRYPSLAVPVHGWVFEPHSFPVSDDFGDVPIDDGVESLLGAAFRGRGGGACAEHAGDGGDVLRSTLAQAWDCSGNWSLLVTWYRQGEVSTVQSNHTIFVAQDSPDARVFLMQRANNVAGGQNWIFPAVEETLGTVYTAIQQFTADPDDPTYNVGYDTLFSRSGAQIDAWSWHENAPANALHEAVACGAGDDFTNNDVVQALSSTNGGSGLEGCQIKSVYLFESYLDRDDGDIYRGTATTSQDEV